ncbi:hypothetical protein PS15p_205057 [Mucor circinelloides]
MDSKAIFYHVKKLNQLGLIVKEDAYASRMITKLLFLKRFAGKANNQDSKEEQSDGVIYRLPVFKEKIAELLKQETGHLMPISDLLDALSLGNMTERKWARVRIQEMHNQGEIEKFNATDGNKLRQCVRLVSSPTTTPTLTTSNLLQQDSIHSSQHFSIERDLPCDYLFYKDVEAAAEKGMTRQDLIDKYPSIDPVQFKLFFESATIPPKSADLMPYLLHRTEEVFGKNRQFRYYTQTGWNRFNEANGNQITEPTLTIASKPTEPEILKEPTSIDEISLVLKGPVQKRPHRRNHATKETAKKRKTTAESTPRSTPPADTPPADTPPAKEGADMESVSQIPSKRPNDDNLMPLSISSLKKRKKDSLRNNTKMRRYGIILDMVEKVHIREFNTNMMNEFKSIELQSPGGQSMARQTFDTLVQELHDQQKLRIYVTAIKKPNGLTDIRKFVLHASLNADSPQVKDFIDHYHLQKPIMDGPSGRKEIKVVNMPVLPSSSKDSGAGKSNEPIAGNSNSWRVNAIENGWISSKWIRAKALHVAMFEYLESKGTQDHMVDMTDFLRSIRLRTVMQIYGLLPYDDPALDAFIAVEENRDTAICDLPADIKAIIIQEAPRIRVRIVRLVKVLLALSLVEGSSMTGYRIPPKIQLLKQGVVRDYAAKEHPVRFTLQLNDMSDVQLYWRDLQGCCLEKHMKTDTIHDRNDIFYNIVLVRLWRSNTFLSKEQKAVLDSFVDFDTKTVPSENDKPLQMYIARKTDLSLKRIRSYYTSLLMAFKKYTSRKEKEEQKTKMRQSMKASPAIIELMQASMEKRKIDAALFKLKQQEPYIQPTFVASRKFRRLRLTVKSVESQRRTYTKKVDELSLSDVEKDVLVHAYSIMKARADTSTFYWSPITKVITTCTPEKCRRTIEYIARFDPIFIDTTVKKLKDEWKEIYQEGIANGDIKDEAPWDTQDYDLPGFLEYFILKLQERETQVDDVVPLPKQLSGFYSRFNIVRDINKTRAVDNGHQVAAYTHCFDEHAYDVSSNIIKEYDEQEVFVYLVMVLIKMILITPDDKYNTKDAYALLRVYPENIIKQAVDNLSAMGMLVKSRIDSGRVPGRGINVSEKFLVMASGVLPFDFFQQAMQFYQTLASDNPFVDLEISTVDAGTAAVVLDLASQGKISIGLQDFEKYVKPRQSTYYPKPKAFALRDAYLYKDLDLRITPTSDVPVQNAPERCSDCDGIIPVSTHQEIESYLHALNDRRPYSKTVYDVIRSFGRAGASISEIRTKFDSESQHEESLLFFDTLESLQNHRPPLIRVIGFVHLRYIASEFISDWFIKQSDGRYILPLMWYDTTGSIIPKALEGCAHAVMGHVLERPGISFATLRDKFQGFFTDFELYHILKYLLDSKRIIARKIQRGVRPKRASIFDKRPLVSMAMLNYTLDNNEITCYWLARDYYL